MLSDGRSFSSTQALNLIASSIDFRDTPVAGRVTKFVLAIATASGVACTIHNSIEDTDEDFYMNTFGPTRLDLQTDEAITAAGYAFLYCY